MGLAAVLATATWAAAQDDPKSKPEGPAHSARVMAESSDRPQAESIVGADVLQECSPLLWDSGGMFTDRDQADELIDRRSRTAKSFQNDDGTVTAIISMGPIHYQDELGQWREIRTDIRRNETNEFPHYAYAVTENTFNVYLATTVDGGYVIQLPHGNLILGTQSTVRVEDANGHLLRTFPRQSAKVAVSRNQAFYAGSYPTLHGSDEMLLGSRGIKHNLIIESRPTGLDDISGPNYLVLRELVRLPDGWSIAPANERACDTCAPKATGALAVLDAHGDPVATLPSPIVRECDASAVVHHDTSKGTVTEYSIEKTHAFYRLTDASGGVYVDTVVPLRWILDPARHFPVSIDPTIWVWTYTWDGATGFSYSSSQCYCGYSSCGDEIRWKGADVWNAWAKFNTDTIEPGSNVMDIDLYCFVEEINCPYFEIRALDDYASSCAELWYWQHSGTVYDAITNCLGTGWQGPFDLSATAHQHMEDNLDHNPPFFGITIHDTDSSDSWYAIVDSYDWVDGLKLQVTYDPPEPDFIVEDIWLEPSCPQAGQSYRIHTNLCNVGDGDYSGSIYLKYYINGATVDDDYLSWGLDAGECDEEVSDWLTASSNLDCYDVKVCIDPYDNIDEENDTNNCRTEEYAWGIPSAPSASPSSGCEPLTVEVCGTSGFDYYDWQYQPPGSSSWYNFADDDRCEQKSCSYDGTWKFRYRCKCGPCWSDWGSARSVTVYDTPSDPPAPSVSNPSGCDPVSGTLTGQSGWNSYDWQRKPPGGSWEEFGGSSRTQPYTADSPGTWQYRYSVRNSYGCWSEWGGAASVTVYDTPDPPGAPSVSNPSGCEQVTGILTGQSGWSEWDWQQKPPGGGWEDFGGSGRTQSYDANIEGTWEYQYRVKNSYGCWSGWGDDASVTVNPLPSTPTNATADPPEICDGYCSTLSASVSGAVIDWYSGSCGGHFEEMGNSIEVCPNSTTTYYARARFESTGCESSNCDAVTVIVHDEPIPWYPDNDDDEYGDMYADPVYDCQQPNNYVTDNTDCDDSNLDVHPGATEVCNGIDDDCDDLTDEEGAQGCTTYYRDHDSDSYGVSGDTKCLCSPEGEYRATQGDDCEDADDTSYPGAPEVCDGKDNDCDGKVDEDCSTWCRDADGDGYGDPAHSIEASEQPEGYASKCTDCDDSDPAVNPGATDLCGEDRNCDGLFPHPQTWYRDADGDSYGDPDVAVDDCEQPNGYVANDGDCDDTDEDVNPAAVEWCEDFVDNDCDGDVDCTDPDCYGIGPCQDPPIDVDEDGIRDVEDNCPSDWNPDQTDSDGDGVGDACDNCPDTWNPDQSNIDEDGCGDVCDPNPLCGAGLCGPGCLGAVTLTLLGLCGMKLRSAHESRRRR